MKFLIPLLGAAGYVLTAAHGFDQRASGDVRVAIGLAVATIVAVALLCVTVYKRTTRRWAKAPALLIPPGVGLLIDQLLRRFAADLSWLNENPSYALFGTWTYTYGYYVLFAAIHLGVAAWMFEAVSGEDTDDPVVWLRRAPRRIPGVVLAGVAIWFGQAAVGFLGAFLGGGQTGHALRAVAWFLFSVFTFPLGLLLARSGRIGGLRTAMQATWRGRKFVLANGLVLVLVTGWIAPWFGVTTEMGTLLLNLFPCPSGWMVWLAERYGRHSGMEWVSAMVLCNFGFVVVTDLADRLSPPTWDETF